MILGLLCVGVYYCYKRKLRKGELRLLETHLWYPSPHGHRDNCRHLPSSLLTNSWLSQPRPTSTKSIILCVRRKMQASRKRNYGSQPHTTSSNLTRTLGSSLDGLIAENHKAELTRYGQRAISRQVCLRCFLGRGRFSDVWMGLWRGEPVTVKIFAANDRLGQILWRRTITAHRSMLLRHRNVQGIMATDWIQYPLEEHGKLWPNFAKQCAIGSPILHAMFISELFQLGTLRDLMDRYVWLVSDTSGTEDNACAPVHTVYALTRESAIEQPPILTVAEEQLMKVVLRLALSLTQGLCFLHSDYVGTRGKPALAHRDLKPSNVFVRSDWTCCIGDVGFSVRAPPNPLPSSMSELNRLYCQHIAQLQTSATQPVLPIHSPQPAELLTENEKLHHELHNNATEVVTYHELTANTIKEGVQLRPASKLRMNKAELLDWWPVGGLQAGTPRYMAPELLNSSANPFRLESHQKADIYSLGLVLWELIIWALPQYLHPKTRQLSQISSSRNSCSTRSSPDPVAEEDLHSLTLDDPQTLRFRGPAYQSEWEQLCARGDVQSDIRPSSLATPDNNSGCHLPLDRTLKETSIVPSTEPSLFIMRQLVCELQLRPRLPVVFITGMPYVAKETVPSPSALCSRLADEEFNSKAQVADPDAVLKSTSVESSSGASSLRDAPTGSNTTTVAYADNSTKILLTDLIRMVLSHFATLLPECWAPDPDSRLTALRIRKTLERTCDLIDATRGLTSGTKLDPHHPAANDGDCVNDPMAIKQILC
ncbi:unnamed protein product [Dicrocoelium dendriticum]|nr:unnamed protein product [Dicrocoelium dendriticum]